MATSVDDWIFLQVVMPCVVSAVMLLVYTVMFVELRSTVGTKHRNFWSEIEYNTSKTHPKKDLIGFSWREICIKLLYSIFCIELLMFL